MAKYPQFYVGALLIAPKGVTQTVKHSLAAHKRIVLVYYDLQHFSSQALALYFANMFSEGNQVQTLHLALAEDATNSRQARFKQLLQWILNQTPEAKPRS